MYNTAALLILIGILLEMFSLEATRLFYIDKKTVREIIITAVFATTLYMLFLSLGWQCGKWFLSGVTKNKYLMSSMIVILTFIAIMQEKRKIPRGLTLIYQNYILFLGIVLSKSIIHLISGAIFYTMDLFTHVFFHWILISTTVFSIGCILTYFSTKYNYMNTKIFGFSFGKLKILLYFAALILVIFVI